MTTLFKLFPWYCRTVPIFLGQPRRDTMRQALDQARAAAAGQGVYADRVSAIRLGWDRLDAWLDMIDARNRHDFVAAQEQMQRYYALSNQGAGVWLEGPERRYDSARLVYQREREDYGGSYFNRFWRRPIVAGHERAVEQGRIVAPLSDDWLFLLDPAEIGEIGGWHRPGELGGNWQPIKTSSRSWSDQGLHYYKGIAWYRQKVTIPAQFEGRPVYLWFGGVDRLAAVWVNGAFMGTSREPREGLPGIPGSFRPFDLPTTREDGSSALNFGGENWVVVRIENKSLAELGTGGILAPVMFWTPNDPDWRP